MYSSWVTFFHGSPRKLLLLTALSQTIRSLSCVHTANSFLKLSSIYLLLLLLINVTSKASESVKCTEYEFLFPAFLQLLLAVVPLFFDTICNVWQITCYLNNLDHFLNDEDY
uniref:Uncharacterized protein n=1 Tax=Panstrongylus lignarius TaxID=156445 RepID=A0A224Y0V5_9HEMI